MMMSLAAAITVGVLSVFGKQPAVREPHPLQPGWKLVHFTESHRASLEKSLLGEMESGMDNSGVEWGKVKDPNFHGFTAADASARIAGMPAVAAVEGLADTIGEKWMAWKDQFQTAFANAHDEGHALQNYASAYAQIDARNRDSGGFELATNEWSFLSSDEFAQQLGLDDMMGNRTQIEPFLKGSKGATDIEKAGGPADVSWVEQLPPTGNQEDCESCWAWTASSLLAAYVAIENGEAPVRLSVQQMMMCADSVGAPLSCKRPAQGLPGMPVFSWLSRGMGNYVCQHDDVPYTGTDEPKCCEAYENGCGSWKPVSSTFSPFSDTSRMGTFGGISPNGPASDAVESELAMATALQRGPLGVAVDLSCFNFQNYAKGVSRNCDSPSVNHAVTLAGLGTCAEGDRAPPCDKGYIGRYWIIQNSWGAQWGQAGYIYAEYGVNYAGIAFWPGTRPEKIKHLDWSDPDKEGLDGCNDPSGGFGFGSGPTLGGSLNGGAKDTADFVKKATLSLAQILGIAAGAVCCCACSGLFILVVVLPRTMVDKQGRSLL